MPEAVVLIPVGVGALAAPHALALERAAPARAAAVWFAALALGRVVVASRLRSLLVRRGVGGGPRDSPVVVDERILAGVPGLGPRRVVISHAALAAFDGAELEATLAHELGHLRRWHRPLASSGPCCGVLGDPSQGRRRRSAGSGSASSGTRTSTRSE